MTAAHAESLEVLALKPRYRLDDQQRAYWTLKALLHGGVWHSRQDSGTLCMAALRQAHVGAQIAAQELHARVASGLVGTGMDRPSFLKSAAGAALAALRMLFAADAKLLRIVPQADPTNLDPIWTKQYIIRDGALVIWDMSFGVDHQLQPKLQIFRSVSALVQKLDRPRRGRFSGIWGTDLIAMALAGPITITKHCLLADLFFVPKYGGAMKKPAYDRFGLRGLA